MMNDSISRKAAIDEVHGAIYEFFDICDDDEESPMTYKDKQLLELNKAITIRIKQLPSASPKGRWIRITQGADPEKYMCPFCHRTVEDYGPEGFVSIRYPYCHCGADMRIVGAEMEVE